MYNMLDDFFNDNWPSSRILARSTFKVDIQEDEKGYVVEAELPRVKKEEIGIELNEGRLTISVVREEKKEEENKNYVHKESQYSSMSRSIYLADASNKDVKASLEDGILRISVPKQEKVDSSKRIEIE